MGDFVDGHPSFQMTRSSLEMIRAANPGASAGILFRWTDPKSFLDLSPNGSAITASLTAAPKTVFKVEFLSVRDSWDLKKRPTYRRHGRIQFRGITAEELRERWEEDFADGFSGDLVEAQISEEDGALVLDPWPDFDIPNRVRADEQRKLLAQKRDFTAVLPEHDVLVSAGGWVLHGDRLARVFGLTKGEVDELKRNCGSVVQHLIHPRECMLSSELFSAETAKRIASMAKGVRNMRTLDADQALVGVLGLWDNERDAWAESTVSIGAYTKRFPRKWVFLESSELLAILAPGKVFRSTRGADVVRSFLLPLTVLGRFSVGPKALQLGAPLLADLVDCLDAVVRPERAGLESWIASIPARERRGFCLELGERVVSRMMPSFKRDGEERQWGKSAVRTAKKVQNKNRRDREYDDEHDDLVDALEGTWARTGGYIDYPWPLATAASCLGWRPSTRSLARCLVSNLAKMSPKWRNQSEGLEVFQGSSYWGKGYESGRVGLPAGRYYPALGPSLTAWSLNAWLVAAGYSATDDAVTSRDRGNFIADLETLGQDMGLCWDIPGHGSGPIALDDLRSMVRNRARWAKARLEPLLPESFLHLLEEAELDSHKLHPLDEDEGNGWTPEQLSRRIREVGLTQRDLAGLIGCSASMISQVLSGKKRMSQTVADKLDSLPQFRRRVNRKPTAKVSELTTLRPEELDGAVQNPPQ